MSKMWTGRQDALQRLFSVSRIERESLAKHGIIAGKRGTPAVSEFRDRPSALAVASHIHPSRSTGSPIPEVALLQACTCMQERRADPDRDP